MSDQNHDAEIGKGEMYRMEQNNNEFKPYAHHDPWTRNNSKGAQETLLVDGEQAGGKIYKPGRKFSSISNSSSVAKRKASVYHQDLSPGTAGFAISVFNLMNAILGSGILGLPYAMAQLGMVLFFVFEVIVAFLALYAIHLLLKLCDQTNVKAYEKLGFIAFGLPGRIVSAICILMQNIGAMSSYLFIVKYELPNVIMTLTGVHASDGSWYYNGDILVIVVTCCIIMPLASLKNIGFLGYTSGFSITCMFFFTGVVIYKKFEITCPLVNQTMFENIEALNHTNTSTELGDVLTHEDVTITSIAESAANVSDQIYNAMATMFENATSFMSSDDGSHLNGSVHEHSLTASQEKAFERYLELGPQQCEAQAFGLTDKWAYSIPTMMFSFVCHTAVLPIYAELKKPCAARMQNVSNTSIGICFILYSLSALFGYLTFYNWIEPELLLMYSYTNAHDVLTMIVRLCVLIAVILTVPLTHFPARKATTFILFPNKPFSWFRHIGIMLGLLTFINLLVLFVPSIRDVFGIIGATASTMLVFVLPSIFYLRIDDKPYSKSRDKIGALCLFWLGIIVVVQSLTVIIMGYFT